MRIMTRPSAPIEGPHSELEQHFSFVLGCFAEGIGSERSAIAHYRNEIRKTGYFKAHFNLARLLAKRGRVRESIAHYRYAVRRARGSDAADALNNLGLLYLRKDRVADAIRAFQRASRLDRRSGAPLVNAAVVHLRRGEFATAQRWIKRARQRRRLDKEMDKWVGYILIVYDVDVPAGVRLLERARKRAPQDAHILTDLAIGYSKLRRAPAAQHFAKAALRIAPNDSYVKDQTSRLKVNNERRRSRASSQHAEGQPTGSQLGRIPEKAARATLGLRSRGRLSP
jgi:tetratricopeptide (TPR) repeat protein